MMLDIESNLKNDTSGTYKKELITNFINFSEEVKKELGQGLTPNQFDKMNRLLQAVDASVIIIKHYNNNHGS